MPMYNLIEYSINYLKISGILWQCYRDVLALDNDGAMSNVTATNVTDSFNIKVGLSPSKKIVLFASLKAL